MLCRNKILALVSTVIFVTAIPFTSMATTKTKISSVSLDITSGIEAGDSDSDVKVTSESSKYRVEDVSVTNEPSDGWEDGDKPKLKVTVEVEDEDEYYFYSSFSKSSVHLRGSNGTVTSVSRNSSSKLIVYIKLDDLEDDNDYDLDVDDLEWDESNGTANWEDADGAEKYEVRLYRGSSSVTSILKTTSSYYDFSSHITKSGYYTFKVRAVHNSSNKGSWEESDSWYVSSNDAKEISSSSFSNKTEGPGNTSGSGAWLKDNTGWWYCNADKSYTVSNWQYIRDKWYYFNNAGYMVTGWVKWKDKWYYCGENGAMYTSKTTPDGYYVGSDGAWIQS